MSRRTVAGSLLLALALGCDAGPDGSAGEAGQDGALGSTGMEGLSGDDGYAVLSEFTEVEEARFGCEEGYRVTRIGVDDGAEGGVAGDATLQDGEVDVTLTECLTRN